MRKDSTTSYLLAKLNCVLVMSNLQSLYVYIYPMYNYACTGTLHLFVHHQTRSVLYCNIYPDYQKHSSTVYVGVVAAVVYLTII